MSGKSSRYYDSMGCAFLLTFMVVGAGVAVLVGVLHLMLQ